MHPFPLLDLKINDLCKYICLTVPSHQMFYPSNVMLSKEPSVIAHVESDELPCLFFACQEVACQCPHTTSGISHLSNPPLVNIVMFGETSS
jgi:hypothetical protein